MINGDGMKKTRKRILWIAIIVIVIAAGVALYMFYPMLTMSPAETGTVADTDIFAVRNARNAIYFVPADGGYILVDAGSDVNGIEESLRDNGIEPASVKWILLTHTDGDHVAALPLFPEAEINMSDTELSGVLVNNNLPSSVDVINPIIDGTEVSLGGVSVKGISAPGHRPGHMVYLLDGKYLFTGDAFMLSGTELSVHAFSSDSEAAQRTIEMLESVIAECEIVLTGHYDYFLVQ